MKQYAIVVAGGTGKRMGNSIPKQFLLLGGKPILTYSITAFHRFNKDMAIVLVLPPGWITEWEQLCKQYHFRVKHKAVAGGITRFESVKKGLDEIADDGLVAIHDGVRPFVSQETIQRCYITADEYGSALPVMNVHESVRLKQNDHNIPADRNKVIISQTPQVFLCDRIKKAYNQPYNQRYTDDSVVFESIGEKIRLVEGNPENIKITTKQDLIFAEALLKVLGESV